MLYFFLFFLFIPQIDSIFKHSKNNRIEFHFIIRKIENARNGYRLLKIVYIMTHSWRYSRTLKLDFYIEKTCLSSTTIKIFYLYHQLIKISNKITAYILNTCWHLELNRTIPLNILITTTYQKHIFRCQINSKCKNLIT